MDSLVAVLALILLVVVGCGLAGLILALNLRARVQELETRVRRLASDFRDIRRKTVEPAPEAAPSSSSQPAEIPREAPPAPLPPVEKLPLKPATVVLDTARPISPAPLTISRPQSSLDSIESLVGTHWLNWIGALVVLVGIAFLLKLIYDRGWIGPAGRVGIGLAFGVGFLLLGEFRLRRFHDLLSQSVSAAGCGALFLTTFLAYKFYEFGGRLPTFALLCWFAAFTVALAVVRNGRILAYLGLLGAYLTPYLLSTGQDQAEALFSYLSVLALAAAFVGAARGWAGIPSLCLVLTWIYYGGWYSRFQSPERLVVAAVGAGGLIVIVGGLTLVRGLWNRSAVRTEECIVLIVSCLVGLFYLWKLLVEQHPAVLGFVLCGTAMAGLAGLRASHRRRSSNALLESTLLGLAAGALLLVIPACLKASGAMLAWALAAAVLMDIGTRSRRRVIELAAGVSLLATVAVGAAAPVVHSGLFHPLVNRVFVAWLGSALAWFIAGARYSRAYPGNAPHRLLGTGLQVASSFMLLGLLSYETVAWFGGRLRLPGADLAGLREWRTATLCLLWALYPAIWVRWTRTQPKLWNLAAAHYLVLGLGLLVLLVDFHHRDVVVFLNPAFLAALTFPAGVFFVASRFRDERGKMRVRLQLYGHALAVVLLSVELYQGLFLPSEYDASRYWIRMALISAAWAAYATTVLGIGISRNLPAWRWLALTLLGITLVKVVLYDMAEVRQIWRVLSFLVLGALLMACSYAYSRRERQRKLEGNPPETRLEVSP